MSSCITVQEYMKFPLSLSIKSDVCLCCVCSVSDVCLCCVCSVSDVLKCPLECARQMTLIAHGTSPIPTHYGISQSFILNSSEHFCRIASVELLLKVHLIPKPSSSPPPPTSVETKTKAAASGGSQREVDIDTRPQTAVERLAYRFNQVS